MSARPTREEIKAVQKVLYGNPTRVNKLNDAFNNIIALMNFNPYNLLSPTDIRNPAGSGPLWFLPDSGDVDPSVIQAANYCDEIAKLVLGSEKSSRT